MKEKTHPHGMGKLLLIAYCLLCSALQLHSQSSLNINPDLLEKEWTAKWITCPGIQGTEYGVYLFRKDFEWKGENQSFLIHVSADNRYKLYVNGEQVSNGPARGDLYKWFYETVDIASHLKTGHNVITAEVWNFADFRPAAQVSSQTGFILQGNTNIENRVNTDSSWRVMQDKAYTPFNALYFYIIGPGEKFNSTLHPWNWMQPDFDISTWNKGKEMETGHPVNSLGAWGGPSRYILYPREIPALEEKPQRFPGIRRTDLPNYPASFPDGKNELLIPANTHTKILFDQRYLTNAYPVLLFSKGNHSEIKLTYAESLVNDKKEKGNRNEIDHKGISGYKDIITADGGLNRIFKTLWFRPFRYIEIEIQTKEEALVIHDFYSIFTGYPLQERASFECDDSTLTKIWDIGWRTQRLCAMETFFDCPYYEQLQYVGDARIQAFVSTTVSGDSRLVKQAISSVHDSRLASGITQSRYPSYQPQMIAPFSLVWATMVSDYWMLNDNKPFVSSMIPGIMEIMNWYESRLDSTGLLGHTEWWNFVDWVRFKNWGPGTPPEQSGGHSSILTLQFLYTLQKSTTLLEACGMQSEANRYRKLSEKIRSAVFNQCWDSQKKMISDTPDKINFSQHANALAILTNTIPKELQKEVAAKILNNSEIAACTLYFHFYLTEAIEKAGLGDQYPDMLEPWYKMISAGLTTFAEEPDPTRSDCHAWSASPVYYFLTLICGIKPAEPGFKSVTIEPHPGRLKWIKGSLPHPKGDIRVALQKEAANGLSGEIILPPNLSGTFIWQGKKLLLNSGKNLIHITSKK